jgi:hypothetical protein
VVVGQQPISERALEARDGVYSPAVVDHAGYVREPTKNVRLRLASIAEKVRTAPDGTMNNCLHWAACRLAWVVWVEGLTTRAQAVHVLMQAVEANGLVGWIGRDRCMATIECGFKNGIEGLTFETLVAVVRAAHKPHRINAVDACAERAAEMGVDRGEVERLFMRAVGPLTADGERLFRGIIKSAFDRGHAMADACTSPLI